MVEYDGEMYRYVHNLQGDIVGILDAPGNLVVEYKYDAWGKPISTTGDLSSTLGTLNPFRYRGHVYCVLEFFLHTSDILLLLRVYIYESERRMRHEEDAADPVGPAASGRGVCRK